MNPTGSLRFRRILKAQMGRMKGSLCLAGVCLLGVTLTELLAPWPLKLIFDYILLAKPLPASFSFLHDIVQAGPAVSLTIISLFIAAIAALNGSCSYGQIYVTSKVGHWLVYTIRRELFSHLQQLSLSFHNRAQSGELLTKLAGDTTTLREVFTDWTLTTAAHVLTVLGMFIIMFMLNWRLSLLVAGTFPILLLVLYVLNRKIKKSVRTQRKQEGKIAARINEVLSSIALVQAFGRMEYEEDRFETESSRHLAAGIQTARARAAVTKTVALISALGTTGTVLFGAWQVLDGVMTPGDLLIFVAYLKGLYKPVRDLANLSAKFSRAMVSVERISELLSYEPEIRDIPHAIRASRLAGDIRFENVSFGYDKDQKVLQQVSFHIHPGQRVALVGVSGAGKSTVVSLLLRLYDLQEGLIRIDDVLLTRYNRESLRREIGIVLQDTVLFGASIRENISYGKPEATSQEVEEAARLAHIHDFILTLPNGYESLIGERGCTLSGGQRQRICLARALIKQPSILIMDEPTAALDTISASLIRDIIARVQKGKTTIVISHQFVAMDQFDQILVLDHGSLVEQGTHRQLLAGRGHYYDLLSHQMSERQWEQEDGQLKPVHSQGEMKKHA
jgi:ABC-type multidrug transport system fused ATPase/permease subunit